MQDLKQYCGEYLFQDSKLNPYLKILSFATSLALEFAIAWVIVAVFDITWDYAVLKIVLVIQLAAVTKLVGKFVVQSLWFHIIGRSLGVRTMRHYIELFAQYVDWREVGAFEEFLIEAATSETIPDKLRTLAAVLYSETNAGMHANLGFDGRMYSIWLEITDDPDFRKRQGLPV